MPSPKCREYEVAGATDTRKSSLPAIGRNTAKNQSKTVPSTRASSENGVSGSQDFSQAASEAQSVQAEESNDYVEVSYAEQRQQEIFRQMKERA